MKLLVLSLFHVSFCSCALSVLSFGAVPNDPSDKASTANTVAFSAALRAADAGPDSTVLVPGGMTFSIFSVRTPNLTDVTLSIQGQVLVNNNITAWKPYTSDDAVSVRNRVGRRSAADPQPPINNHHPGSFWFEDARNLTVVGSGRALHTTADVDGQGYVWWWADILSGRASRPRIFLFQRCVDVTVKDLYLKNSPYYHIETDDSFGFRASRVNILVDVDAQRAMLRYDESRFDFARGIPTFPLNTDGFDPAGINIVIEDSFIQNYDDAVAVKPNNRLSKWSPCTSNVLVRNCTVWFSVGMSIGSVPSNVAHNCIDGVVVEDVQMNSAIKALYIKSNPPDDFNNPGTGQVTNITYSRFEVIGTIWYPIFVGPQQQRQPGTAGNNCSFFYPVVPHCETSPYVYMNHYSFNDISVVDGESTPGVIVCDPTMPCDDVAFNGVNLQGGWTAYSNFTCINAKVAYGTSSIPNFPVFPCNGTQ
jgi:polygalacturonase